MCYLTCINVRPLTYCRDFLLSTRHLCNDVKLDQELWNTIKALQINKPFRGCRAGMVKQRRITTCTGHSQDQRHRALPCGSSTNYCRGCNSSNLVHIPLQPMTNNCAPLVKFAAWNARSIKPKTVSVCDFIISSKLDILAITESWLTDDDRSNRALADIKNNNNNNMWTYIAHVSTNWVVLKAHYYPCS